MARRNKEQTDPYLRMCASGAYGKAPTKKELEEFFAGLRKAYGTRGYLKKVLEKIKADTEAIRRNAQVDHSKLDMRITY